MNKFQLNVKCGSFYGIGGVVQRAHSGCLIQVLAPYGVGQKEIYSHESMKHSLFLCYYGLIIA